MSIVANAERSEMASVCNMVGRVTNNLRVAFASLPFISYHIIYQ